MNNAALGWATFVQALGQSVPGVLDQFQKDAERERQQVVRRQAAGIMGQVPKYGTLMDPGTAVEVIKSASPEDQVQAVQILRQRGALPGGFYPQQDPRMYESPAAGTPFVQPQAVGGSALQALGTAPEPKKVGDEQIGTLLNALGRVESKGDYSRAHPEPPGGPSKRAYGKYGIQASTWFPAFPQFGLDPNKPEDIQRFVSTPALQDAMAKEIVKQGLDSAGGDLRKFRAWYYGGPGAMKKIGTPDEWAPQKAYQRQPGRAVRKELAMPSVGADADAFMKVLREAGGDVGDYAAAAKGSDSFPYDNAALLDLIKEKPKPVVAPRRVTYQDQERYLLEKTRTPELAAYLKPYTENVSKLADRERDLEKEGRSAQEKAAERYDRNVTEVAKQALEVWKTKYNYNKGRSSKARDEHLANLKELRTEMQQRLKDISDWSVKYLKAGNEKDAEGSQAAMASLFPEFFNMQTETSFWGGSHQVKKLDPNAIERETLRLRQMIDKIGAEIAPRGGVDYIEGDAGKEKSPQDFFING